MWEPLIAFLVTTMATAALGYVVGAARVAVTAGDRLDREIRRRRAAEGLGVWVITAGMKLAGEAMEARDEFEALEADLEKIGITRVRDE